MLNGISPLLGPDLLATLCRMGHGDEIVFADAHFPGESLGPQVHRADGLMIPALLDAVLPLFPMERHASVVSLWSAMGILGSAVAPTMAAGILEVGSWRLVFAVIIPFALLAWWGGFVADVRR